MANKQLSLQENEHPTIVIDPPKGFSSFGLKEVWQKRELAIFLAMRTIKVRYQQTVLGAAWAVVQPFFTMIVFSIFFGEVAGIPSEGVPYPVFSYAALVPWSFFSSSLSRSSESLVANSRLIQKIYFPRLIIPISAILSGLIDFVLAFLMLLLIMLFYGIVPTINIIFLPFLVVMTMVVAGGAGAWFSALNVQFRDVRYTISFVTQFWLFATPIAYPSSLIDQPWRTLYAINPMVGVVDGFRWALLGTESFPAISIVVSSIVAVLLLVSGVYYFKRVEDYFADVV